MRNAAVEEKKDGQEIQATKRLLQGVVGLSRRQAVMYHQRFGAVALGKEELSRNAEWVRRYHAVLQRRWRRARYVRPRRHVGAAVRLSAHRKAG